MFCPQCRSEYIESVKECPDCGVPLVDKLPPEDFDGSRDRGVFYTPLVRTYSAKDVAFIHSILGGTNIRYYIRGEGLTHLRPLADASVLMVAEDDIRDARALLKDLPLSFYPWAPDGGRSPEEEAANDTSSGDNQK
jgi:hypothetical protein